MKQSVSHKKSTRKNQILVLVLLISSVGAAYEAYQTHSISKINQALRTGEVFENENYPFHKKFSDAFQQGQTGNFKHAVQGFGQTLEIANKKEDSVFEVSNALKAKIHYNIGNNLFRSGLQRLVTEDGAIQEEAKFDYLQAKASYEQALKLDPTSRPAKFNLSLLLGVIPGNIKTVPQDPSGMEISNLPQGLP
jgi:mxaK protein